MSDQPYSTYEQTLVKINDNHASAVRKTRYSPWRLGLYVSLALAVPIGAFFAGQLVNGDLGAVLATVVSLPVPFLVVLWAYDAQMVEHQRMVSELELLQHGPVLPVPPVEFSDVGTETHLQPGLIQNGEVVARAANPTPDALWLRNACLKLARAGQVVGAWSRAALAEGPDTPLTTTEWEAASKELQALGMFWVRPGRNGGLEPTPGKDVAESIKRLEVAQ